MNVPSLLKAKGAGGAMVPLNERDLLVDLMRHLGLPVIVAARTALGTISLYASDASRCCANPRRPFAALL